MEGAKVKQEERQSPRELSTHLPGFLWAPMDEEMFSILCMSPRQQDKWQRAEEIAVSQSKIPKADATQSCKSQLGSSKGHS